MNEKQNQPVGPMSEQVNSLGGALEARLHPAPRDSRVAPIGASATGEIRDEAMLNVRVQPTDEQVSRTARRPLPGFAYKLGILSATVIWGLSFVVMKDCVETMTPAWLIVLRFLLAGIILAVPFLKRLRANLNRTTLLRGLVVGVLLWAAFWVQTIGLTDTTPGKNAFLTATYCVIVPFCWWLIAHRKPTSFNIIAALMCIVGIGCVSLDGNLSIGFGDAMTLVCAVLFAVHIVYVAKFTDAGEDAYVLTVWQFIFGGLVGCVVALVSEPIPPASVWTPDFAFNLVYLVLFSTLIAMLLQNVGLAHVAPAPASLLLSLESVFGVLFSVILYGEELSVRLVGGFALIFAAIVISEIGPELKRRRTTVQNLVPGTDFDPATLPENIVLIGMPGCGKSTVGHALADLLGKSFVDGDDVVREVAGKTLPEIMDERGPMGFLEFEGEVLAGVQLENTVFAPGGSCAYEDAAMRHLGDIATIVYLETTYEEIDARVGDLRSRGVVLKNGIGMSLRELFDEREPLYRQYADVTVNEEKMNVRQATAAVVTALKGCE